ncbi:YrbL family protein [uncultured Cohaesibacter sp.]|uniref:YrbL family protein n=1 Tax=uncultured Cohaesibacter sp. TaxID=1002546 RepID=UPI002AA75F38|nr:YrbL family protein [uncultured Cohaesibacter sp.]
MTIELKGTRPLSSGSFRDCYQHPKDAGKCIKVKRPSVPNHVGKVERCIGKYEPDPNIREYEHYRKLLGTGIPLHCYFPKMYGLVDTDLGTGVCLELVRGSNGEMPISLEEIVTSRNSAQFDTKYILQEVIKFSCFCAQFGILASCDEPGNLGFVRDNKGLRLVSYDLKLRLNKELIPVSTLFAGFRRRKITRRFNKLLNYLGKNLGYIDNHG